MSSSAWRYIVLTVATLALAASAHAQKFPERRHIREGNRHYESQRFADAEKAYRRALQNDSLSVEGAFNLGNAHYATGNFSAAEEQFHKIAERKEGVNEEQKAAAYYNLGNAQFQQQKLDEALESYKESLKLNPSNLEAKFNYAYTKAMKEQQEQNQQNQDNQQNQQNQDNKDQQNNQQQGNDNQQQNQPQDDNQQQDNQDQQQQPEQPEGEKPKPSEGADQQPQSQVGPSKENEQVLNAVQAAEDKTREKVDAERVVGVARSGKNW